MLRKNHEVIALFLEAPGEALTFTDVKRLLRKTSNSYVENSLKEFVRENILTEERKGKMTLYRLRDSLQAARNAGIVSEAKAWSRNDLPLADLEKLAAKVPGFFILLVAGSYAMGTQRKDSDLDVIVLCDDAAEPKKIIAELRQLCELNVPPIHLAVFRRREFLAMLLDPKQNYGKEAAKQHLVVTGGSEYQRIIQEAIAHGFHG